MSEPLIWTSKGNLPVDTLKHAVEWRVTSEQIVFIESYTLDGEVVKQSSHIHILTGAQAIGEAANLTEN